MSAAVSSSVCSFLSTFRVRENSPSEGSPGCHTPAPATVEGASPRVRPSSSAPTFMPAEKNAAVPSEFSCGLSGDTPSPRPCGATAGSASSALGPNASGSVPGQAVVRRKQLSGAQKRKRKRELLAKNRVEPASLFSFLSTTVTSEAIYENWQDLNRAIREESARYEARTLSASSSLLLGHPDLSAGCCCCSRAPACWAEERGRGTSTLCVSGEDGGQGKRVRHADAHDLDRGSGTHLKKHCGPNEGEGAKRQSPVSQERPPSPSCHAWGSSGSSTRSCCTSSRESGREDEEDYEEDEGQHHRQTSPARASSPPTSSRALPGARGVPVSWRVLISNGGRSRRSSGGSSVGRVEAVDDFESRDGAETVEAAWHTRGGSTASGGEGEEVAMNHLLTCAAFEGEGLSGRRVRTKEDACSAQKPLPSSSAVTIGSLAGAVGPDRVANCLSPCCSTRHSSCCSSLRGEGSAGGYYSPSSFLLSPVSDDASSVTSSMTPSSPPRMPRHGAAPSGPSSPHSSPRLVARCACTHASREELVHDVASPAVPALCAPSTSHEDDEDLGDLALWPAQITEELRWRLVKKGPVQLVDFPYPRDATQRRFGRQHYWRTLPSGEKLWRSWLVYSRTRDAVYCFCCKLFSQLSKSVVTTGFRRWKGIAEVLRSHEHSRDHRSCMLQWKCLCLRLHADVSFGDLKQLCVTTPTLNVVGRVLKGEEDDEAEARAFPMTGDKDEGESVTHER
ncbi:hypothetical protein NCLIV_036990 [Neospora caninum Liverpool]|uniref:TTF-type domain-containing protein n=1 Tax=Neospora caninum (strain Liverpool) TaxID=572307 RepID=F0VJK6_NEOCL|nr:hypothetical protein NCLIV_036990 [Neospora caninum Liverpool]CBZ53917.1 hypothetical protein NCLIV_036990 [Neospora caninum Liverpool]CEL67915.1 TPA: hypothetical protein BN1204_036990 [Neospora caninum Liverpool]|eukprot:XP_003883949.1 hypothetical protein NCLIV_036990 [Neospora caninum Liverpool]